MSSESWYADLVWESYAVRRPDIPRRPAAGRPTDITSADQAANQSVAHSGYLHCSAKPKGSICLLVK